MAALYTFDPQCGEVRLTSAGYEVVCDAARRATGCTMEVIDAITMEICKPNWALNHLIQTRPDYSPRIDSQHHGHIAGTLVRAFNAANAALGLDRRAYVPSGPSRETLVSALKALVATTSGCQHDVRNPCWAERRSPRPADAPLRHWGGGPACPVCVARAFIAQAEG